MLWLSWGADVRLVDALMHTWWIELRIEEQMYTLSRDQTSLRAAARARLAE
jgi:hypothetical protein